MTLYKNNYYVLHMRNFNFDPTVKYLNKNYNLYYLLSYLSPI